MLVFCYRSGLPEGQCYKITLGVTTLALTSSAKLHPAEQPLQVMAFHSHTPELPFQTKL